MDNHDENNMKEKAMIWCDVIIGFSVLLIALAVVNNVFK